MSTLYERLHDFRYHGFPLGLFMQSLVRESKDIKTQQTLQELPELAKKQAITLLDAHRARVPYDMMAAGLLAVQHTEAQSLIVPAAAYLFFRPDLLENFFAPLNHVEGMQVMPVFRQEERNKTGRKLTDHSGYTEEDKQRANQEYMQAVLAKRNTPHHINVIAPYGSRRTFGTEVRSGVVEFLKSGSPVLLSATFWDWRMLGLAVRYSEIQNYSRANTNDEIQNGIRTGFKRLMR